MHDSAAVSHFICAASSAKLYLLMVMLFRGTYLFILRGLLGWLAGSRFLAWIYPDKSASTTATSSLTTLQLDVSTLSSQISQSAFLPRLPPSGRSTLLGESSSTPVVCTRVYTCVCTTRQCARSAGRARSSWSLLSAEHWRRNKERNC